MKKKHIPGKKLIKYSIYNKEDSNIEEHISNCSQCSDDVHLYNNLLTTTVEKIRPGKKEAMRSIIIIAAIDQFNESHEKPKMFKLKYAFSIGIFSILLFLAGMFLLKPTKVAEPFLTIKSSNPEIIKTAYKNEKASFPFTIKTDKKVICEINGILNTKFLFYGPGKLTIVKQKEKHLYTIKLDKGNLFIASKKGLNKKINFETSRAKIFMIGAKAWISTSKSELKVVVLKGDVSLIDNIKLKKTKIKTGHFATISKNKVKVLSHSSNLMGNRVKSIGSKFFSNWKKNIGSKIIKKHNITSANRSYIITLKDGSFIKAKILKSDSDKIIIFDGFKKMTVYRKNIKFINKMKKLGTEPLK